MSSRSGVILAVIIASCVLLAAIGINRLRAAQARFDTANDQLITATSDAREIVKLRRQSQRAEERKRPEQDLIARVHAVMADAGLPVQEHFKSLRGEADQSRAGQAGEHRYRQQTVSLSLQKVQPRQLGAFLDAWIRTQPVWTIARIELVHDRENSQSELNVYTAIVTFTAIYVADSAGTNQL